MEQRLALIAAVGPRGIIGSDNALPWRLPKDLKYFRRVTTGHVVIMGRRTFESFGSRPLPKRLNVVLSTRMAAQEVPNLVVARSLGEALAVAQKSSKRRRVFVIGGQRVYEQSIDEADELYLSGIEDRSPTPQLFGSWVEGDAYFPRLKLDDWELCHYGREFRARNTLQSEKRKFSSELYFRVWKLVAKRVGCSEAERRKLRKRADFRPSLIEYWDSALAGA